MRASIIAPPHLFRYSMMTDYHLIPAHHLTDFGQHPLGVFREAAINGHFIIVDNGVTERPHALGIDFLVRVALQVGADELVIPDKFDDMMGTIAFATAAIARVRELKQRPDLRGRTFPNLMAVCHGQTEAEWIDCYSTLEEFPEITTIGLPKVMERNFRDRVSFLARMHRAGVISDGKQHHLLGVWSYPGEVKQAVADLPWVRGIDTCFPVMLGINGIFMDEDSKKIGLDESIEEDPNEHVTLANIETFIEWAQGGTSDDGT